jgi:hypothetical protein
MDNTNYHIDGGAQQEFRTLVVSFLRLLHLRWDDGRTEGFKAGDTERSTVQDIGVNRWKEDCKRHGYIPLHTTIPASLTI